MRKITLILFLAALPALATAKTKKPAPLPAGVAAQVGTDKLSEQMVVTTVALVELVVGAKLSENERNTLADAVVATFKADAPTQAASGAAVVELYELLAHASDPDAVAVTRVRLRNAMQFASPEKYKVLVELVTRHAPALAIDAETKLIVMPDAIPLVVQTNDAVSKMSGKKYGGDAATLAEQVKTSFAAFAKDDKERYAFAVMRNMAIGDRLTAMSAPEKQALANTLGKRVKSPDDVPAAARDLETESLPQFQAAHPTIATHEAVAKRIDFLTSFR